MGRLLISLIVVLQFAHYFFSGNLMFYIGWSVHDFTILALLCVWLSKENNLVVKTMLAPLIAWRGIVFAANLGDIFPAATPAMLTLEALFFGGYILKQAALIIPTKSDPYTKENYMYALAIPDAGNKWHFLNLLRPLNGLFYGGRAVIGGDYYWRVKGRAFVKQRIGTPTGPYIFIDTGIPINAETSSILDARLNEKACPFWNDCAKLSVGISPFYILVKRRIKQCWKMKADC